MSTPRNDPPSDAPWRRDQYLKGKFAKSSPDDIQALVHDGDPRRTRRAPELCWVRIQRAVSDTVYLGEILNQPLLIQSVTLGDEIMLVSAPGFAHPLYVTADYMRERFQWAITPCNRCGASECFDPPSVLARFKFPDAPAGSVEAFTSFCASCDGVQVLTRSQP